MSMPGLNSNYTRILQNALYELSRITFFKRSTDRTQFTSVIAGVHSYIDDDDVLVVTSYAMNKHHYYAKCISLLKQRQKSMKTSLFMLDLVFFCEIAPRVIVVTNNIC